MNISKEKKITVFSFALSITIAVFIVVGSIIEQYQADIERAGYVINSEIGKLQYAIDSRILDTEVLEMIIVDGNGSTRNFDKVAKYLYQNDGSIRSLQLAPNGNVTYVYPLEGNEEAFGNLFDDADRKAEAQFAKDTGKTTLAGPFELYQGGVGAVARNPIYIEDENGNQKFWGFSIVVFHVLEILQNSGLDDLKNQGYEYRVWRSYPDSEQIQIIAQSIDKPIVNPVTAEIKVPNGAWILEIVPKNGWLNHKQIALKGILGLVISVLVSMVVYGFFTVEKQKKDLAVLANTDPLTGLYNERFLSSELKRLVQMKKEFGLFYLDLDKFKQVNDTYGHDIGDNLLVEVSRRIRICIRQNDYAFRIGGDEFAIIIQGHQKEDFLKDIKQRLETTIEQPYQVNSISLYPKVSLGYSRYPEDQQMQEALVKQADQRMYCEKRGKK